MFLGRRSSLPVDALSNGKYFGIPRVDDVVEETARPGVGTKGHESLLVLSVVGVDADVCERGSACCCERLCIREEPADLYY